MPEPGNPQTLNLKHPSPYPQIFNTTTQEIHNLPAVLSQLEELDLVAETSSGPQGLEFRV